jgi:hypothetical protein
MSQSFLKILKEIFLNRVSPFLLLLHWILAFFYFPVWRVLTVAIHPHNEDWQTQILLLLDLPALIVGWGIFGESPQSEPSTVTYVSVIIFISLQWILVGCVINVLFRALFPKYEGIN